MFPFAYSQKDILAGDKDRVGELQKMLMRANCYDEKGRQDDGDMGSNTQRAIMAFATNHGHAYYGLMDSLVFGEAFDRKTGESRGVQLIGVKPVFMKALAHVAAENMIYKAHVIKEANKDNNPHSERLALYMEMRGDFLGQDNPNYTPLKFTEEDIDIMARTAWGEARGESDQGRAAVMFAILNRTLTRHLDPEAQPAQFKFTIRETCKAGIPGRKQFSTWNTKDPNYKLIQRLDENSPGADNRIFAELKDLAREALAGNATNPIGGAEHYHTTGVTPSWSKYWKVDFRIGVHKFFDANPQVDRMNAVVDKFAPIFAKIDDIRNRVGGAMTSAIPAEKNVDVSAYRGPK